MEILPLQTQTNLLVTFYNTYLISPISVTAITIDIKYVHIKITAVAELTVGTFINVKNSLNTWHYDNEIIAST